MYVVINFRCRFFITCFFKYSPPGNIMDVSNFIWTNQTETEVDLAWVSPKLRSPYKNMTYDLTWVPNSGKSSYTRRNHTAISNLTSGQVYEFTLHFNLFDGERWIRYTHQTSVTVTTSKLIAFLYLLIYKIIVLIYI